MRHVVEGDGEDPRGVEVHVPARVVGIHLLSNVILARIGIEVEARLARLLALDVAVPVSFVAASTAASTGARDKVVGTNDIDQVEEYTADRTGKDTEVAGVRGNTLRRNVQRHRARSDAIEPTGQAGVRRAWIELCHAGVEVHVGDRDVDSNRAERPGYERAGTGRGDLHLPGICQRHTTADQERFTLP